VACAYFTMFEADREGFPFESESASRIAGATREGDDNGGYQKRHRPDALESHQHPG